MMDLGSEGLYLDENRGTNPSRHLPGPKAPVKNPKMSIWGSRGFWDLRTRPSDPCKSRVDLNRHRDCIGGIGVCGAGPFGLPELGRAK